MVWPRQFCKHIIQFRGQQITACEPDPATPTRLLIVCSCFPITDTTWPIKPKIFAIWFFTESLLTLDSSSSILSPVHGPLKPLLGILEVKAIFTLIHIIDLFTGLTFVLKGQKQRWVKLPVLSSLFSLPLHVVGKKPNKQKASFTQLRLTTGILSQINCWFRGGCGLFSSISSLCPVDTTNSSPPIPHCNSQKPLQTFFEISFI